MELSAPDSHFGVWTAGKRGPERGVGSTEGEQGPHCHTVTVTQLGPLHSSTQAFGCLHDLGKNSLWD